MYDIFEDLCSKNNVTPYKVGKETKIATSTLSDWKNGKSTPKQDKLKKIADYFDVSVDYLMTGKTNILFETAKQDAALSLMDDKVKEYALRLDKLSEDKRSLIFNMIEQLEK